MPLVLVPFVADSGVTAFHSYIFWHCSVCEPLPLPKLSSTVLSPAVPPHEGQESQWAVVKLLCSVYWNHYRPFQQMGTPNEKIAKLIFMELNNAWSDFESDASQQQMFPAANWMTEYSWPHQASQLVSAICTKINSVSKRFKSYCTVLQGCTNYPKI